MPVPPQVALQTMPPSPRLAIAAQPATMDLAPVQARVDLENSLAPPWAPAPSAGDASPRSGASVDAVPAPALVHRLDRYFAGSSRAALQAQHPRSRTGG